MLELREADPNSTDVFEDNMIDIFYPQRPAEVCLYDFVCHYVKCGKDATGRPKYTKLSKPCLPNHRLYDPNKEGQKEGYYYSLCNSVRWCNPHSRPQLRSLVLVCPVPMELLTTH